MISLLGSNHFQIYQSHLYHSQIYYVYHDQTFHYHSQQILANDLLGRIYQSSTYQIRSPQTFSQIDEGVDGGDGENERGDRYKLDFVSEKEVDDVAFQDQYENET
jgi:hypothetical protein